MGKEIGFLDGYRKLKRAKVKEMENKPLVSVIIPVYNVEKYLRQCVDSVIQQSYQNIEIFLVNDGSKDGSGVLCDEYAKKDARINVFHVENGGAARARNIGLDHASGEYIIFLDSDDYWDDAFALEKVLLFAQETQSDVVCFGNKRYYQQDDKTVPIKSYVNNGESSIVRLMEKNQYISSSNLKFYSSGLIQGNNIRFNSGQKSEDIEWSVKILQFAKKITWYEANFYVYRKQNSCSVTSNLGYDNVKDVWNVIQKYSLAEKCENRLNKRAVLSYLANEYVLLLTFSNRVKTGTIKTLLREMKSVWWILKYDNYPYVKKVRKIRILGFAIIRKLLGLYSWIKN